MKKRWSAKDTHFLIENNDKLATWQLARVLGRTPNAILCKCKELDLKRSPHFKRDPDKIANMPKRPYKPSPRQLKPGLYKYGSVKNERHNYWWIKVEGARRPIQYHRYIWKQAGRIIPPGMRLMFKDGNIDNVTLENLELVSSAAVNKEVQERIKQARWGNKERVCKQHYQEYNKKYKEKKKLERQTAKTLGKDVKELSFIDKVLMGII